MPVDKSKIQARFNGWYWDVSHAMKPDTVAKVGLALPVAKVGDLVGLFFENTLPVMTATVAVAGRD